jgi:copper chaperone NosL
LVNDFTVPKELVDAKESHYLISKNIPSPMGAFLSAFAKREDAINFQKAKGGELYDWMEIQEIIKTSTSYTLE